MRPNVSHIGLAVDTGDGGSCRWKRPPLGGRTRLVIIIIIIIIITVVVVVVVVVFLLLVVLLSCTE